MKCTINIQRRRWWWRLLMASHSFIQSRKPRKPTEQRVISHYTVSSVPCECIKSVALGLLYIHSGRGNVSHCVTSFTHPEKSSWTTKPGQHTCGGGLLARWSTMINDIHTATRMPPFRCPFGMNIFNNLQWDFMCEAVQLVCNWICTTLQYHIDARYTQPEEGLYLPG